MTVGRLLAAAFVSGLLLASAGCGLVLDQNSPWFMGRLYRGEYSPELEYPRLDFAASYSFEVGKPVSITGTWRGAKPERAELSLGRQKWKTDPKTSRLVEDYESVDWKVLGLAEVSGGQDGLEGTFKWQGLLPEIEPGDVWVRGKAEAKDERTGETIVSGTVFPK